MLVLQDDVFEDAIKSLLAHDHKRFQELTRANPEIVNSVNSLGDTLLLRVMSHGDKEAIGRLVLSGADVNIVVRGHTYLHRAAELPTELRMSIATQLLEAGAKPDGPAGIPIINDWSPLQLAAALGQADYVKLLVSYGANVNRRPAIDFGETALMFAARAGRIDVVEALIQAGANRAMTNLCGQTANDIALSVNRQDIADMLAQ